jgi:predicted nucleotidyltransferase
LEAAGPAGLEASAGAAPAAVARAEVGEDMTSSPAAEEQMNEFLRRLREAAGQNLESVILYGSAAAGDYDPEYSNINLVCVLNSTGLGELNAIAPAAKWWRKQNHPLPLVITREELERSADVFAIELLDMQRHHRVLFGKDVVSSLEVSMLQHRAQLEYELREKLILLRQQLLLAAGERQRIWDVLLRSLTAFATLFRHALIALGQPSPASKRETFEALTRNLACDTAPFERVLDIREHRLNRKKFEVEELAAQYLAAVQEVTVAVDRMLDSQRH